METHNSALTNVSGGQPPAVVTLAGHEHFSSAARHDESVSLVQLVNTLWQRKRFIISFVLVTMVIATILVQRIPPVYSTQSLLIIESRAPNIVKLENVIAGLSGDEATIQSEKEILQSPDLAKKVIHRLQLQKKPEFNPALREPGWLEKALSLNIKESIASAKPVLEEPERESNVVDVLNEFLARLNVSQRGDSRVLAVEFSSRDPKLAAEVANTLLDIYSQNQRQAKLKATAEATSWLNNRVVGLRAKVEASEKAVEEYRKNSGLLQNSQGATLDSQQLSELNTQLILAKTQRSEAQARLRQIQRLINAGRVESSDQVRNSSLIQSLRTQETELQRKAAELSTEYGERHPFIVSLNAEIKDLKDRIRRETDRIVEGFRSEVAIAQAREQALQESVSNLKDTAATANEETVELRALEREADANRALLDTFLSRLKETSLQEDIDVQQADARIISLADPPTRPTSPKKGALLALAFMGSSLLSMLIMLIFEQRDRGYRNSDEIEKEIGLPVIGMVPRLRKSSPLSPKHLFSKKAMHMRRSMLRESIRNVYASLFLDRSVPTPKKILITSTVPEEGKTAIAVNLARIQEISGNKVVVIDADFRNPGIHKAFDGPRTPGLAELISGEASLQDVLQRSGTSDTYFIPAGKAQVDPLTLLTSSLFQENIDLLSELYDLVILDAPPSSAFADARVLSTKVDSTIYVIRWSFAKQKLIKNTLRRFAKSSGRIGGIVLSMVEKQSHETYRYGYSYGTSETD